MRLGESFGHAGFVLTLLNFYTGARWSEQVGLGPHDYDALRRAIAVRAPLTEAGGHLHRRKRTKTPAGKRWVQLPAFLHALYTELIDSCEGEHVFTGPRGGVLRRQFPCALLAAGLGRGSHTRNGVDAASAAAWGDVQRGRSALVAYAVGGCWDPGGGPSGPAGPPGSGDGSGL